MIKFEYTDVYGFQHAIRGMRNSWESWEQSDSEWDYIDLYNSYDSSMTFKIGENDHKLATQLSKAGNDHAKYLRQIQVWVDIIAPLYWWKQFDQYKIGTTTNSESTMHTLTRKELSFENFSWKKHKDYRYETIQYLNDSINLYKELKKQGTHDESKELWEEIIEDLPSAFLQKRTVNMNYQIIKSAYHSRKNHKLDLWKKDFIQWVEALPYSELITLKNSLK